MSNITIFISYSWQDGFIADRICEDLEYIGYNVVQDKKELRYTDSIPTHMERIRREDYVLILVSSNYLKSENCMKELIAFQKDERLNVLLPIITSNTKLYELTDRIQYVKYWEEQITHQEAILCQVKPWNAALENYKFQTVREISYNIANFMATIIKMLLATPEDLWIKHYKQIDEKTGFIRDEKKILIKKIKNNDFDLILKSHTENQPIELSRCNLSDKVLPFNNVDLSCANLKYSNLRHSYIINADFSGCNLQWVDFTATMFRYVSFCNADLRGANFTGIKFENLKIRGGDFSFAIMDDKFREYIKAHGGIVNEG